MNKSCITCYQKGSYVEVYIRTVVLLKKKKLNHEEGVFTFIKEKARRVVKYFLNCFKCTDLLVVIFLSLKTNIDTCRVDVIRSVKEARK